MMVQSAWVARCAVVATTWEIVSSKIERKGADGRVARSQQQSIIR
jgi:hypothetical protein